MHDADVWTTMFFEPANFNIQNATHLYHFHGYVSMGRTYIIQNKKRVTTRYLIIQTIGPLEHIKLTEVEIYCRGKLFNAYLEYLKYMTQ